MCNELGQILNWTSEGGELFYGTLELSIVRTWDSPFPGLRLAAGLWVDIFAYKYKLQYGGLYFV